MRLKPKQWSHGKRIATMLILPALGLGLLTACGGKDSVDQTCDRLRDLEQEFIDYEEELEKTVGAGPEPSYQEAAVLYGNMAEFYSEFADKTSKVADDAEDQELADALNDVVSGWEVGIDVTEEASQFLKTLEDEDLDDTEVAEELVELIDPLFPSEEKMDDFVKAAEIVDETCDINYPAFG